MSEPDFHIIVTLNGTAIDFPKLRSIVNQLSDSKLDTLHGSSYVDIEDLKSISHLDLEHAGTDGRTCMGDSSTELRIQVLKQIQDIEDICNGNCPPHWEGLNAQSKLVKRNNAPVCLELVSNCSYYDGVVAPELLLSLVNATATDIPTTLINYLQ